MGGSTTKKDRMEGERRAEMDRVAKRRKQEKREREARTLQQVTTGAKMADNGNR